MFKTFYDPFLGNFTFYILFYRIQHLNVVALQDDPSRIAKSICIKTQKLLGSSLSKVSGFFIKGRVNGEALVETVDEKKFYLNFVKGVPHGRIR